MYVKETTLFSKVFDLLFYLFAAYLVLSSAALISIKNPVYSVLLLIFAFFNASALFLILGAEFVAMSLLIVYVGAVAVLFLFVVMMLNISKIMVKQYVSKHMLALIALGIVIFSELVIVFYSSSQLKPTGANSSTLTNTHQLGLILYTQYGYLFQLAGAILLVAIIGSIALTLDLNTPRQKTQNHRLQMRRNKASAIELVKPHVGQGVSDV